MKNKGNILAHKISVHSNFTNIIPRTKLISPEQSNYFHTNLIKIEYFMTKITFEN